MGSSTSPPWRGDRAAAAGGVGPVNGMYLGSSPSARILFNQALFLGTGMASTIGAQWLKYQGAANSMSFLTILAQYLGMILVLFLPNAHSASTSTLPQTPRTWMSGFSPRKRLDGLGPVSHRGVMMVALAEVGGSVVLIAGLFLAGSGLYMVLYSSIIVFTAVGNRVFLRRRLAPLQWAAVIAISFGLSLTSLGNDKKSAHDNGRGEAQAHRIAAGIVVSLLGTWIHSWVYTLNDHFLTNTSTPSSPRAQCVWVGLYSTGLTVLTIAIFSIPTIVHMSSALLRPGPLLMHVLLMLSSLGHSASYFELVNSTGAVATGVIQALRAVGVFALSHVWFCGTDEAQCYTSWKGVATVVVVGGVVGFAYATSLSGYGGGHGGHGGGGKIADYEEVRLTDFADEEDVLGNGGSENGDGDGGDVQGPLYDKYSKKQPPLSGLSTRGGSPERPDSVAVSSSPSSASILRRTPSNSSELSTKHI